MTAGNPHNYKGKVTLQRIRLNNGGYDDMGRYYGTGAPLYYYANEEFSEHVGNFLCDGYFRASDRAAAKAHVRALPLMCECRFYN